MPSKSPEPSSYSLDEMMDRLREGDRERKDSEETGELVTRPDGSQVMRVKKRKRRSEQPKSKKPKQKSQGRKAALITFAGFFVLFFLFLIAALVQLAKFNSEGFQDQLEKDLSTTVEGEFSISRLSVTPAKARADELRVQWPDSSLLEKASLRNVEAGVGLPGFLGAGWRGQEILAKTGLLRMRGGAGRSYPSVDGDVPFHYEGFLCRDMDLFFGAGENPPVKFEGVELSVRGEEGSKQAIIHGGFAELRGWGRMEVGNGVVRFEDGGCVLSTLRLKPEGDRGDIVVKGDQVILPGGETELELNLSNVSLSHMLGPELGKILDGTVSSQDARINFSPSGFQGASFVLPVKGVGGQLTGLPFLYSLRTVLSDTEFAKPYFREISATITRKGDRVMIDDLVLSEKGFMEIRGKISVSDQGELAGKLRVGVYENKALDSTGRSRSLVFSDPVGGYLWVEIDLSGTVDIPEDNWNDLLRKAKSEAAE